MNSRKELIEAAMQGIRRYLTSTRGAHCCGPGAYCEESISGFFVTLPGKPSQILFRVEEEEVLK